MFVGGCGHPDGIINFKPVGKTGRLPASDFLQLSNIAVNAVTMSRVDMNILYFNNIY